MDVFKRKKQTSDESLLGSSLKSDKMNSENEDAKVCGIDLRLYNVLVMSFGFLVLFSAYNTLQNYATSLFPGNLGYWSLGLLYGSVCVVVPFAPAIVASLGERASMILGGSLYVAYLVTLIHIIDWVVLLASFFIGAGAAILWVAQGAFLIRCSTDGSRSRLAGLFWGIFQICNVIGNAAAYFLFDHVSKTALYSVFSIAGAAGVAVLFLLRPLTYTRAPPQHYVAVQPAPVHESMETVLTASGDVVTRPAALVPISQNASSPRNQRDSKRAFPSVEPQGAAARLGKSPSELIWSMLVLFKRRSILMLLLPFFLSGFELAFWTGEFPRLLHENVIGLVLMFAGIGEIIGGFCVSRLSDRVGKSLTMFSGSVIYIGGLMLVALVKKGHTHPILFDAPLVAYFAALAFGIGDCVFNTQIYAILGEKLPAQGLGSFTIFQLLQNAGSAAGYYYSPVVPVHGESGTLTQLYIQVAVVASSCFLFLVADHDDSDGESGADDELAESDETAHH